MLNLYVEQRIAEQRRAEMLQQAERERVVRKLIQWIKQEKRDKKDENERTMKKPEIVVYEN